MYALQQDYREAKRDLDLAADLSGALPEIYQSRGLVEMLIGRFDKAEKDFSQAVALGAVDNLLLYNRGVARSMLGDSAGAHDDYARSCRNGYPPACSFSQIITPAVSPL